MIKGTKTAKILKLLYVRGVPMRAREISAETGIPQKMVWGFIRPLTVNRRARKFKGDDGKIYFVVGKEARMRLILSGNMEEEDEERVD